MKISTRSSGGVSSLSKSSSKPSKQDADKGPGLGTIKSTARGYGHTKVTPSPDDKGSFGTGGE